MSIHGDLSTGLSTISLVKFEEPASEGPLIFEERLSSILLMNEQLHDCESQLDLGRHTVTAAVERNVVYKQELYEVKVTIGY